MQASGDIALAQVVSSDGAIEIIAGGAILDNQADEAVNIGTTGLVSLSAVTGIGTLADTADLDLAVGTLQAQNASPGDIVLEEADTLTLVGLGVDAGAGTVHLVSIAGAIMQRAAVAGGDIIYTAATQLSIEAAIDAAGTVRLDAVERTTITAAIEAAGAIIIGQTGAGAIDLGADLSSAGGDHPAPRG